MKILEIKEPKQKSEICDCILRKLAPWFGIEESLVEYVEDVQNLLFFAAFDGEQPKGFVALKVHNCYTAELYVMGVLQECHRQKVGTQLIASCEAYCKQAGHLYLTVKTVDCSRENSDYRKTRSFYSAMGFLPLEVFPTLWGEANPCLFLIKVIS